MGDPVVLWQGGVGCCLSFTVLCHCMLSTVNDIHDNYVFRVGMIGQWTDVFYESFQNVRCVDCCTVY